MTSSDPVLERPRVLLVQRVDGEGVAEALEGSGFVLDVRDSLKGLARAVRAGRPDVCVLDVGDDPKVLDVLQKGREDAAFRHVPVLLLGSEEVLGIGSQLSMTECVRVPVAPAHLIARIRSSVEVKRLLDYGERKSERLAALLEISRALNSTLDSGAILYHIARKIGEGMELARCSFIVPDLTNGIGRVIACKDDPNIQSLEINLNNYPEIIQVLRSGRRVVIADVQEDPIMASVRKFADVFKDQSIMTLPLKFQNETIGVLQIRKKSQKKGFSSREIEYCELLANAAASSLKNAQLYEDIEKHNTELRRQKRELEELSEQLTRKNDELIELQRLKEELTAMIVHDLRTPLMIVQGVLDLQYYRHRGKPDERVLIEDGMSVTKKMLQLISNLLEVSKVEAGELRLDHEDVEVGTFVRETVETHKVLAESRGIEVVIDVGAEMPVIRADRGCLGQILDNLLANAFKFTPDDGRVEVSCHRHPDAADSVCLAVQDTGPGIAPEETADIFKKFRQARAGRRQGTGLGLTIVDLLTKAHGGAVSVSSELGRGSRFEVRLPLTGNEGERKPPKLVIV